MDWKALPSLAALRAFDALAREGSLSAAGRELNVTHAAVAQHLRALEDFFGETLALRDGQAMRLTPTGQELATALGEGFDRIAEGVAAIRDRSADRPVMVTLTPSFAETWLTAADRRLLGRAPRRSRSASPPRWRWPTCAATASTIANPVRRWRLARMRRGAARPESLFVVVAAPGYTTCTSLDGLLAEGRHAWFFSGAAREQKVWGEAIGVDFSAEAVRELPSNSLVLQAVRAGLGLAVQSRALVEPDLAAGTLAALHEGDPRGLGYHIVTRPGVLSPGARAFRAWLRAAARQANVPQT